MINWMIRLCTLCSMSFLSQTIVGDGLARNMLRVICGLLMLHMTMESAQSILGGIAQCGSLSEIFSLLLK